MTQPPAVSVARDVERAVATLTLAFVTDPAVRWAWPDPAGYLTYFPEFVRAFGGRAFGQGTAHQSDNCRGVALWLPPAAVPDEDALGALVQRSMPSDRGEEVLAILEQMAHYHPGGPHWYLPLIGVDPAHQGRGHGSALLAHALALCDRDHLPAYLESSNVANLPLYERHGFAVLGTIQVGSAPTFWPMLRPSR